MILTEKLKNEHLKIKEAVEEYLAGNIKRPDVKKVSAGFGIYNTRRNSIHNFLME